MPVAPALVAMWKCFFHLHITYVFNNMQCGYNQTATADHQPVINWSSAGVQTWSGAQHKAKREILLVCTSIYNRADKQTISEQRGVLHEQDYSVKSLKQYSPSTFTEGSEQHLEGYKIPRVTSHTTQASRSMLNASEQIKTSGTMS